MWHIKVHALVQSLETASRKRNLILAHIHYNIRMGNAPALGMSDASSLLKV